MNKPGCLVQRTIQLESVQAKDGQNFGRETKDVCINFSNGEVDENVPLV